MRPSILFPLFASVTSLRGIGPRLAPLYKRLCGEHIVDLLWHLPTRVIDRRYKPEFQDNDHDNIVTLIVTVIAHKSSHSLKRPHRVVCMSDDSKTKIFINYFNAKGDYLSKLYPLHHKVAVSGLLERYKDGWHINHPDYVVPIERLADIPRFDPVYPLSEGLTGKMLRKTIAQAIDTVPDLPEWGDPHMIKRENWPTWNEAIKVVHNITGLERTPAHRRLAYDELLADQLALAVIRHHYKKSVGKSLGGHGQLRQALLNILPFKLTAGQQSVIEEISADMKTPRRMLRLLQGDVGSGKTIVALMAMIQAVEAGTQAALMAPTEILARQHYTKLSEFMEPLGIKIGLIVGRSRSENRQETLEQLSDGDLKLVVGTHALFQDEIQFKDLGLIVVDEQHRFGVNQRLLLSEKGRGVDILMTTATPIPRTLTLTAFGDMDISCLVDKPAGRKPIDTRVINSSRLDEVIEGLKRQIAKNAQAYWVCPLIEESEIIDIAAATDRVALLTRKLGTGRVGLLHGRMKTEQKDEVMSDFVSGKIKVLVSTTVIEVGVDVPQATLMIVEHAERFGLAQLHQLRGRVGRGTGQSNCLLIYQNPLSRIATARLNMLRKTEDGFRIAEEDLRLRGPGELLGVRQSGIPEFRLANIVQDQDLISAAHDHAQLILSRDSRLEGENGQALRILLYLFQRDTAVPLLRAG
jgi:ATP-dependent DNA helicase RecG